MEELLKYLEEKKWDRVDWDTPDEIDNGWSATNPEEHRLEYFEDKGHFVLYLDIGRMEKRGPDAAIEILRVLRYMNGEAGWDGAPISFGVSTGESDEV